MLLPSAASLLFSLSNPLNLTLLTSHLLSAPALWDGTANFETCRQIFRVFYTACSKISELGPGQPNESQRSSLSQEEWVRAVVKGADPQSPRWRHLILLGGLLLGLSNGQQDVSPHLRSKLELALLMASKLSLHESHRTSVLAQHSIAFVLNHTFELLPDHCRTQLDYDALLPMLVNETFFSEEGLEHGYWLRLIDDDVVETTGSKLNWPGKSSTFARVKQMQSRAFVASLGPMSRLIAHSIECVSDAHSVSETVNRLGEFARTLTISWRQNKLSKVHPFDENEKLDVEAINSTLPVLWQILRMSLFTSVIVLRAVLGRVLQDPLLSRSDVAPLLAMQCLHTLRNLYFISSRLGQTSFSEYIFVSFTATDILAQYPDHAERFLTSIRPNQPGKIPEHSLDRCFDLFFLNTAEHFTLVLSPQVNEELLIAAALPYLSGNDKSHLGELFESGHSLTLAVLSAPKSAELSGKLLPFYLGALMAAFPQAVSTRQFRLAFKTVIRISGPPSRIAEDQPLLQATLMELLRDRALKATLELIPNRSEAPNDPPLSEGAALTLAIIDSLCHLSIPDLNEWLPLTAELLNHVSNPQMRQMCRDRFWEALNGGEMDIERAALCVAWWTTRGGREFVFSGDNPFDDHEPLMSDALVQEGKL